MCKVTVRVPSQLKPHKPSVLLCLHCLEHGVCGGRPSIVQGMETGPRACLHTGPPKVAHDLGAKVLGRDRGNEAKGLKAQGIGASAHTVICSVPTASLECPAMALGLTPHLSA